MPKLQLSGLWIKDGSDGGSYLSGGIKFNKEEDLVTLKAIVKAVEAGQKVFVNVYPNSYKKEGDNKPDWQLYLNLPDGEGSKPATQPQQTKAKANILQSKAKAAPASQSNNTYEYDNSVTEDDIPF